MLHIVVHGSVEVTRLRLRIRIAIRPVGHVRLVGRHHSVGGAVDVHVYVVASVIVVHSVARNGFAERL